MNRPQRLTFDEPSGRWRLGVEPLHAGDCLELELAGGHWVPVRFEWAHEDGRRPSGIFLLGLPDELDAVVLPLEGARLRG